jgi:hypothetical protein
MQTPVYHVTALLGALASRVPVGTTLGLVHVLWTMVSGALLVTRGALIPGLSHSGLSDADVRRAWAAVGRGRWTITQLLRQWRALVEAEGQWHPRTHGGYQTVAADVTAVFRPRLKACPTTHYHAAAGKALPAIPLGVVARTGAVGAQRLGVPLAVVRADPADPSPAAHNRAVVQAGVAALEAGDVLVVDRGFALRLVLEAEARRYVVRLTRSFTGRRATPPPYRGRGRPPTRGAVVRPLARTRTGRRIAATPADVTAHWERGGRTIGAEGWTELVLPGAVAGSATFTVWAFHDPRYAAPLLVAASAELPAAVVYELYRDRWPVEQLPLAAKQMVGAGRQFVWAAETCQRLPELALLAGAVLSYAAATGPVVATGSWDRRPARTPGRLRRVLGRGEFPHTAPLPARIRRKASVTGHLRTGAARGQVRASACLPHGRATGSAPEPQNRLTVSGN